MYYSSPPQDDGEKEEEEVYFLLLLLCYLLSQWLLSSVNLLVAPPGERNLTKVAAASATAKLAKIRVLEKERGRESILVATTSSLGWHR